MVLGTPEFESLLVAASDEPSGYHVNKVVRVTQTSDNDNETRQHSPKVMAYTKTGYIADAELFKWGWGQIWDIEAEFDFTSEALSLYEQNYVISTGMYSFLTLFSTFEFFKAVFVKIITNVNFFHIEPFSFEISFPNYLSG